MRESHVILGQLAEVQENAESANASAGDPTSACLNEPSLSQTSSTTLPSEGQYTPGSDSDSDQLKMDASTIITQGALRQITENNLTTDQPIVQCVQSVLPI